MDQRLFHIVNHKSNIEDCVNEKLLKECTIWYPFTLLNILQWNNVKYLHILRKADEFHDDSGIRLSAKSGIYMSHDCSWTLVILENSNYSEQSFLELCSEQLEQLYVISECSLNLNLYPWKNLRSLDIIALRLYRINVKISGINNLKFLHRLVLSGVYCDEGINVSYMSKLQELEVSSAYDKGINIFGIQQASQLTYLRLINTYLETDIDISWYSNLEELCLTNNKWAFGKTILLKHLSKCNKLQKIFLLFENIEELPNPIPPLPQLTALSLTSCSKISSLNGIEQLQNLAYLNISNLKIKQIPEGIRRLKNLKILDLSFLELEELPDWLPELGLPLSQNNGMGINLRNTTVAGVDMSIFNQPEDMILKWFENLKRKNMVPLQEAKVVFLGDGEAGKTHTIARLLNDGGTPQPEHFDDQATPGIVIKNKNYKLNEQDVTIHYWDFGGQEILHSMHRMFLTERTLYVVLINARDDTQDDRARYWLHNIRSFAGTAPVLLVLNKIDQNPNASVNETELRELYGGLRKVIKLSALNYSIKEFNTAFTDVLLEEISKLGTIGTLWPKSWAKIKLGLQNMQANFITGAEYKKMCQRSGENKSHEELLNWFNDLGVSFFYQGNRRLENYIILRPEWITNGIYILLFNKSEETNNGIIPKRVIHAMLDPEEGSEYRRVLIDVHYDVSETEYVLEVMRKFRLSYPVSEDAEFIPALCQRDSMAIAKEYAEDPNCLEFQITYDYLPENVIHRLMVEMRYDLQLSNVWRTGALFCQQGTDCSAVVKSEGNVLRIFVRSKNRLHRPNTYMCILLENIKRINSDMKLEEANAEVVYKFEGGCECFEYQDLLNALEEGEETYRSKKLRRRLNICDILNQTGFEAEQKLMRLREDILTACMQLQGDKTYWNTEEDVRNTYLRNTLRNMRYLVNDQSFQGVGGGERRYGELDLDIRQETNIPWTILEALRIKDGSKTEWNKHLKKLLDNYNPSGLRHLFLLTYVDFEKDKFMQLLGDYSKHISWYDPEPYLRLPNTFSHVTAVRHGDPSGLQMMRCIYDCEGSPTTVTHIFVRIGR